MRGRGDGSRARFVLWQYRWPIMTDLAAVDSVDIQILVDNVTDPLSSVPSFVETVRRSRTTARGGLGAGWRLPVLCRARSFLPARDPRRRQDAYGAFRHRAGRLHLRAECLAAGNRPRGRRGGGAHPPPPGSPRRDAARASAWALPPLLVAGFHFRPAPPRSPAPPLTDRRP